MTIPSIGGFFPLETPKPCVDSVLEHWTKGLKWVSTRNARSALLIAVSAVGAKRLWLPSYICQSVQVGGSTIERKIYSVDKDLSPQLQRLDEGLMSGDACLIFAAFGQQLNPDLKTYIKHRTDVVWIEDCAHALDPGPLITDFRYFSPRKLIGVPEGGILVHKNKVDFSTVPTPAPPQLANQSLPIAAFQRACDPEGRLCDWYQNYQLEESQQNFSERPMSRWALSILESTEIQPLIQARQKNFAQLQQHTRPELLHSSDLKSPFGLILRVDDASSLAMKFHAEKIYVQRHWSHPLGDCPITRYYRRQLLTVPIDHRLTESSLERLGEALNRLTSSLSDPELLPAE